MPKKFCFHVVVLDTIIWNAYPIFSQRSILLPSKLNLVLSNIICSCIMFVSFNFNFFYSSAKYSWRWSPTRISKHTTQRFPILHPFVIMALRHMHLFNSYIIVLFSIFVMARKSVPLWANNIPHQFNLKVHENTNLQGKRRRQNKKIKTTSESHDRSRTKYNI